MDTRKLNIELNNKLDEYKLKLKNTKSESEKKYIKQKINRIIEAIYLVNNGQNLDENGRIENDIYDIYSDDKMKTHGIFTKIIDDEDMLISSKTDILAEGGDNVAYDIRQPAGKRKEDGQKIYLPQPPENKNIVEHYVPTPYIEENQFLTTATGLPIFNNQDSLKVGPRGPTLLEDFHLREKLTNFDHEQIPERVVHARGSGAYGTFTCTKSMKDFTIAKFLQETGKKTSVFVRFSQVVGSKGSADTVRDVRGFATKFYTEEGNYDLVGNNIPIFFIQDAIKFPDLVHSIKPEPDNEMPQSTGAHDNFWDFISLTPESMHMIIWVLSDIGLMRSYRTMEGAGVNTFKFINENGVAHFVKFHWKPHLGIETMEWSVANKVTGKDIDYLRRDLWESIKRGFYPKWDFMVQLMPIKDEDKYEFDPLDPTKIWPEKLIPMIKCGELILNRNPSNFFAEVEQSAFHPGHIVPGIDFSNDPLLQGRLFSYLDTQINRFNTANFNELPINRPLAKVRNNQRQGFNRIQIHRGPVNYEPNTRTNGQPLPGEKIQAGGNINFWKHNTNVGCLANYNKNSCPFPSQSDEWKIRAKSAKFQDHFSQANARYLSLNNKQKKHLIGAFHVELGSVKSIQIRRNMIKLIAQVNKELAKYVADGLILE